MENKLYTKFVNKIKEEALLKKPDDTVMIATGILKDILTEAVRLGYLKGPLNYNDIAFCWTGIDPYRGFCFDDPTILPKTKYTEEMIKKLKEIQDVIYNT